LFVFVSPTMNKKFLDDPNTIAPIVVGVISQYLKCPVNASVMLVQIVLLASHPVP